MHIPVSLTSRDLHWRLSLTLETSCPAHAGLPATHCPHSPALVPCHALSDFSGFYLEPWCVSLWHHNPYILHVCKTSTTWTMLASIASWRSSLAFLDHSCNNLRVHRSLNQEKHSPTCPSSTSSLLGLRPQQKLFFPMWKSFKFVFISIV